tara:strand:+ start:1223 stop:2041 length:819 start_codon:yes stop_codon:yes gene_type:complete
MDKPLRGYTAFLIVLATTVLSISNVVAAVSLYALDGRSNTFGIIDTTAGAASSLGVGTFSDSIGGHGIGLAYNSITGVMYARSFDNLYTIDIGTGATTLIGPSHNDITGLTFDSSFTTLYSISQYDGSFYSVNPDTGATTLIGNSGILTPLGLSTRSDGTIFGVNIYGRLYTIDPHTGASTLITNGLPGGFSSIAFDADDILYGVKIDGDFLGTIDTSNGSFSQIGSGVGPQYTDVRGLVFAVPEPTSLAISLPLITTIYANRRRNGRAKII